MVSGPEPQAVAHDPGIEVLRAFKNWLAKESFTQAGAVSPNNDGESPLNENSTARPAYFSPRAALMSTSDNINTAPVSGHLNGPAKTMQSVTRRVLPTVVYGLIVVALAIAGLERFPSSHDVPGSVGDPRNSATALFGGRPDPISVPANEDSSSAGKALVRAPSSSQGTPAGSPNTSEEYGAIQRQISVVSNELAALRSSVEKLAATQQQMGADIAALKASEENIYQKLLTEDASSPAVHVAPRKPGSSAGKPQPIRRLPPAQVSNPSVGAPLQLR